MVNCYTAAVSTEALKSNPGIIFASSVAFLMGLEHHSNYQKTGTREHLSGCVFVLSETHRQTCSSVNQPKK